MPPLPPELADAIAQPDPGWGKRERTRHQLLLAALEVFSARGVAASTVQEIAAAARMASGTVYNHFKTKEEIVQAVGLLLADTLCRRISASYDHITQGAERMAIGNRRYLWLAEESPAWVLLLLDVGLAAPAIARQVQEYSRTDLRLGVRQKDFKPVSEAAAMDLIVGTITQAMQTIALGMAPAGHGIAVAATVLRGLGMTPEAALAVAKRPLPPFVPPTPLAQQPARPASRGLKRRG